MPSKVSFDKQIATLDALRQLPEEDRIEPLRKSLGHRNNFVVARSADLVREARLTILMPELLHAFDRFFESPEKSDAQCWAKNALSRALFALEYQEPEVYLRGMRHIQMEPVWGGRSDTAGTLRATCAVALVQCRKLSDAELLAHLIDLAADKDKAVRTEAMRAVEQVGSPAAALLLRLRAVLGNDEPEVLGACYAGILRIEGVKAIPWIQQFLAAADDSSSEAAFAIAGTHSPEAFAALRDCLEKHGTFSARNLRAQDPAWRSLLLAAIALTRQDEAMEFLLEITRAESLDAEAAIAAILRSGPSAEIVERLEKLVTGNPRLARIFAEQKVPS